MEQWYNCPKCDKDILYFTNPCPHCKSGVDWRATIRDNKKQPIAYTVPYEKPQQQADNSPQATPQQHVDNSPPAIQQQQTTHLPLQTQQYRKPLKANWKKWLIGFSAAIVVIILLVIVVGYMAPRSNISNIIAPKLSISEIKSRAVEIPYDNLMRLNEKYVGQIVYYRGGLVQATCTGGDNYMLRLATKKSQYVGYMDNVIYINYKGTRLLEKDVVDVWGTVTGLVTYKAVLGNEITIPGLNALNIELVSKGTE